MHYNKVFSSLSIKLAEAEDHIQKAEKILIKEGVLNAKAVGDFRRIFNYIKECQDEEISRKNPL